MVFQSLLNGVPLHSNRLRIGQLKPGQSWQRRLVLMGWSLVLIWTGESSVGLMAQTLDSSAPPTPIETSIPELIPPALQQLMQDPQQIQRLPASRPSQLGLTIPSLWWVEEQFGQKTVLDWIAYPNSSRQKQQVHVYLRSNLWTRFSYLERYAFVTHFSHLTRTYGYQLVMLERNGSPVASYICDFEKLEPESVQGIQDSQQKPIKAYSASQQRDLECNLWLNPAFPSNVF